MDSELRHLEQQYRRSGDTAIWKQLNLARQRHGLMPISRSNIPDITQWAGYLRYHLTKKGQLIVLVMAASADIDDELGRYALICDEHGGLLQADSFFELMPEAHFPESWCDWCRNS